jgi:hypothetical protein
MSKISVPIAGEDCFVALRRDILRKSGFYLDVPGRTRTDDSWTLRSTSKQLKHDVVTTCRNPPSALYLAAQFRRLSAWRQSLTAPKLGIHSSGLLATQETVNWQQLQQLRHRKDDKKHQGLLDLADVALLSDSAVALV